MKQCFKALDSRCRFAMNLKEKKKTNKNKQKKHTSLNFIDIGITPC